MNFDAIYSKIYFRNKLLKLWFKIDNFSYLTPYASKHERYMNSN